MYWSMPTESTATVLNRVFSGASALASIDSSAVNTSVSDTSGIPLLTPQTAEIDRSLTPYNDTVTFVSPRKIEGWEHYDTSYHLMGMAARGLWLQSAVPPLPIKKVEQGGYKLLDGHHRLNAAHAAGLRLVPVTLEGNGYPEEEWRNPLVTPEKIRLEPFQPFSFPQGHFVVGWIYLEQIGNLSLAELLSLAIPPSYWPKKFEYDTITIGTEAMLIQEGSKSLWLQRRGVLHLSRPVLHDVDWNRILTSSEKKEDVDQHSGLFSILDTPFESACELVKQARDLPQLKPHGFYVEVKLFFSRDRG